MQQGSNPPASDFKEPKKENFCALCHKKAVDSVFRPFCSKKCKMVDLYKWVSGHYVIPGDPAEILKKEESEAKEEWEKAWQEDLF